MTGPDIRTATSSDIDDLVDLRAQMFHAMGVVETDPHWREAAAAWFAARVDHPDHRIFVIERDGRVISCVMGTLSESSPQPGRAHGRDLTISNVSTVAAHRGRGYAGALLAAVLDWGRGQPVPVRAKLFATQAGRRLYERAGFVEAVWPAMRADLN